MSVQRSCSRIKGADLQENKVRFMATQLEARLEENAPSSLVRRQVRVAAIAAWGLLGNRFVPAGLRLA